MIRKQSEEKMMPFLKLGLDQQKEVASDGRVLQPPKSSQNVNESIVEDSQENYDISIGSDHRPSARENNISNDSNRDMKAEYDQLLKNVEQRLRKLNNPYIQVDFGSDSSSSVFSKSDRSEQVAISNSQRLRNFYEQHRADNAAQRQNAEEKKKMSRSQNSAMKDEGKA